MWDQLDLWSFALNWETLKGKLSLVSQYYECFHLERAMNTNPLKSSHPSKKPVLLTPGPPMTLLSFKWPQGELWTMPLQWTMLLNNANEHQWSMPITNQNEQCQSTIKMNNANQQTKWTTPTNNCQSTMPMNANQQCQWTMLINYPNEQCQSNNANEKCQCTCHVSHVFHTHADHAIICHSMTSVNEWKTCNSLN